MLCNLPSWGDLHGSTPKSPWDLSQNPNIKGDNNNLHYDESALLASRLRQHQISGGDNPKTTMLIQQQLLARNGVRSSAGIGDSSFLPIPLSLGNADSTNGDNSVAGLYNGFSSPSLTRPSQLATQQSFNHSQNGPISTQNYGPGTNGINQTPAAGNGGAPPVRQRVRARRGQATDPHSIAERLRRERIAERMKGLQELVPNANKTDKASMLDEIIDYVKFLQLQVKVLSMSRLGGAAAVAPLLADISNEGGADSIQTNGSGGRNSNGTSSAANDSLTVTENQVAKLMEEDMGSAMQYLQGKGLCLMPISLASAISSATNHSSRNVNSLANPFLNTNLDGPTSPSISVLTAQSAMGNGVGEVSVRDATSVSKP
ncbi:hypothetical protein ACHQM5_029879 [Ranunculus cassubicifolius]